MKWLVDRALTKPTLSYAEIIDISGSTKCTFPRDKIYGLLGLVHLSKRIKIDYATPIELVFLDVGRALMLEQLQKAEGGAVMRFSLVFGIGELASVLGLPSIKQHIAEWDTFLQHDKTSESLQLLRSALQTGKASTWTEYDDARRLQLSELHFIIDYASDLNAAECLMLNLVSGRLHSLYETQATAGSVTIAAHLEKPGSSIDAKADASGTGVINLEKHLFRYRDEQGQWWDSAYEAVFKHRVRAAQEHLQHSTEAAEGVHNRRMDRWKHSLTHTSKRVAMTFRRSSSRGNPKDAHEIQVEGRKYFPHEHK
jgi:hypothetical protein